MNIRRISNVIASTAAIVAGAALVTVNAVAQTNSVNDSDARVETSISRSLAGTPDLLDQTIDVTTLNGIVTLSGAVRIERQRLEAEQIAAKTLGVQKVIDQLTLSGAQDSVMDRSQREEAAHGVLQSDGTYAQPFDQSGHLVPPPNGPQTDPYGRPLTQPGAQQSAPLNDSQANGQAGYEQTTPPRTPTQPYGLRYPAYRQGRNDQPYYGQSGGTAVTIPTGTLLRVRVNQHLDSRDITTGMAFDAMVVSDVIAGGEVAIPRGASVRGTVVQVEKAGAISGRGELGLRMNELTLGGTTYQVQSDTFAAHGGDKTIQSVNSALGLGALGAIFGAVAGGGAGAAIGAGVGGALGLGSSAMSVRGNVFVPSESVLTFRVAAPLQITTVSQAEMQRLAYGPPDRPQLGRQLPPPPYYGGPIVYPYPRYFYGPYGYYRY